VRTRSFRSPAGPHRGRARRVVLAGVTVAEFSAGGAKRGLPEVGRRSEQPTALACKNTGPLVSACRCGSSVGLRSPGGGTAVPPTRGGVLAMAVLSGGMVLPLRSGWCAAVACAVDPVGWAGVDIHF
jgi:hypothetical protein